MFPKMPQIEAKKKTHSKGHVFGDSLNLGQMAKKPKKIIPINQGVIKSQN